jgi:GNAT superfamily N-acetyltransferase
MQPARLPEFPDTITEEDIERDLFLGELVVLFSCAVLEDKDDYVVVAHPGNPGYYWGNFIQFKTNTPRDIGEFERIFREHLPHITSRYAFAFNDGLRFSQINGLSDIFSQAGYRIEKACSLTARVDDLKQDIRRPAEIRKIETDEEWAMVLENQSLCRTHFDAEFIRLRVEMQKKVVRDGHGFWIGAFVGDQLVGDLGLFRYKNARRFQAVGTHPDFRRRGIAMQMVIEAAAIAAKEEPGALFIIMTDLDSEPEVLYRKCGFMPRAIHVGFLKHLTQG